jgi:excisionase family DNA binding protein
MVIGQFRSQTVSIKIAGHMNTELIKPITIKIIGELIIQKDDLKGIFPQIEIPLAEPPPGIPKFKQFGTDGKLPRLAFTVKETAEMLAVSHLTIYRLIKRGLLKRSLASRKIIISKIEIERFLKETSRSLYEQ